MKEQAFPHGFDPSTSLLFLGAGFSFSGTNIRGGNPPAAGGLELELKTLAGLPPEDPSDIHDLSGYVVREGKDIFGLLSGLYTMKALNSDQKKILSQPWLRIYTTNYDDSAEIFSAENAKRSYSLEDPVPGRLAPGSVVHLHGYIHKCTRENVLRQLILSHYSYVQQIVLASPWWDVFERDVRVASNIFFVGYDLKDFEPAKYLTKNPNIAEKCHFILRPTNSPVVASRLADYGTRHAIEVSGFASQCDVAVVAEKPKHANALRSFRYTDILQDSKVAIEPTPLEVQSLFVFGKFLFQRLLSTFPESRYVLLRRRYMEQCANYLKNVKTIIIHSKVGNGKSTFIETLSVFLSEQSYSCFALKENISPTQAEIDFISGQEKPVVVFPSYDSAYANLHLFGALSDKARFIVEMETSTLQVRFAEVVNRLQRPVERINLDQLDQQDLEELHRLLDQVGIAPPQFLKRFGRSAEMRDIVLSVFDNKSVAEKIDRAVSPFLNNPDAKVVLFCSSVLKSLGLQTSPGFLRAISGVDAFETLTFAGEIAYEFVDFDHDRIEPHSALFSEYIIKRYLSPDEFSGAIFRMASEAAKRMAEGDNLQSERTRSARSTLSSLLRFSFLNEILSRYPDKADHIERIYEHCRRDVNIQGEPLFWLQYSIFMQDIGEWGLAERHMDTAYERGKARPGFLTFQLDTNYLGLCLDLECREGADTPVPRAQKILDLIQVAREMVGNGNHRGHVLKVLRQVEPFTAKRRGGLTLGEKSAFVYHLHLVCDSLQGLEADIQAEWGTRVVEDSLRRAIGMLL